MTKRQKIWLAVAAAGGVLAVFCCACVIAAFTWWSAPDPDDVVADYLEAVQEDDTAAAREFVCDSWRSGPFGDVTGHLTTWTDIVDWEITDTETHDRSAEVTARITFRVLGLTNSSRMVFTLIKEDGDWKVCGARGR